MRAKQRISMEQIAKSGKLPTYTKRYLKTCLPPPDANPKHPMGRFPNLAGFCRWLGCGISEYEALRLSCPAEADWLAAVMEDEALNSQLTSATLLGTYLKRRLGYNEKSDPVSGAECGEMKVVFEHDIGEDGL